MKRARKRRRAADAVGLVLAGVLLVACPSALALNPALDVSQYAHTAWKVRDGFIRGAIFAIPQTPDGYLWLGTESGLVRFDGVRAVPWQPPDGEQLPSNFVESLLASQDGTFWIGTHRGLASWKNGKLTQYSEFAGLDVGALLEDRAGTVWIGAEGSPNGKLCALRSGKPECYSPKDFGRGVGALYQDHNGNLWVAAGTGLWRWAPGVPERYSQPQGMPAALSLTEDDSGAVLLATHKGLETLVRGKIESYALPGVSGQFSPTKLLRSSDGSLWIGTWQGLLHSHQSRTDVFKGADGLSADFVVPIFEDREGSVWVGTQDGLDRFRDVSVPTMSRKQGLASSAAWSVLATPDGSVWIVTAEGLNRWRNGHVTLYRSLKALGQKNERPERELGVSGASTEVANSGLIGNPQSLGQDERGRLWASTSDGMFYFENGRFNEVSGVPGRFTQAIAADSSGNVWISTSDAGLLQVAPDLGVKQIAWSQFGHSPSWALLPDQLKGGLWLGFPDGGVVYFKDGQVRASYTAADGLGNGRVSDLRFGSRGTLWAATEGGLSRIKDGHVMTLTSKNGLPCDAVHWLMQDADNAYWLYKPCGLVRIARSELDAWVKDPTRVVQFAILGVADGVRTPEIPGGYPPTVTKSPDGRIWFLPRDGVSVLDPQHLPYNKVLPPVQIEQITADRKSYDPSAYGNGGVRLPARTRDLEIDYTALSLAVPEKVRFRYKLEGRDGDWEDAGNRRQAFYSDLAPRKYRFRVMACNNSGVWNEAGAFLDFSVAPAYYQTWWFRLSSVAALLALAWAVYQLRLRQVAYEFSMHLEGRVTERTRIARELHDTLLQDFQAVLLFFQGATDLLPDRPELAKAKEKLQGAITRGAQAVREGRDAVQGLRFSTIETNDLSAALSAFAKELAASETSEKPAVFDLEVEGTPRDLHPILRDEVYRIASEALRNAFRHAQASRIEVEVLYGAQQLRVRIRDDGKGVDSQIVTDKGRAGHWGLPGMHERAKLLGGNLEVWSKRNTGTEIQLSIPAAVAYAGSGSRRGLWFSGKGTAVKS